MKPHEGKHALSDNTYVLQFSDMSNFDKSRFGSTVRPHMRNIANMSNVVFLAIVLVKLG